MNFNQLKYVEAIKRYGSMREAARQLYITQPSISQQINLFEKNIGFQVFKKQGRDLVLTPEGEALLPIIKSVIYSVQDLELKVKEIKNPSQGLIRLGIGPITAQKYLPEVLPKFNSEYPEVKFTIFQGGSIELTDQLINNKLDVAIVSTNKKTREFMDQNHIECKVLFSADFAIVVSDQHPLAKQKELSISDLWSEKLILYSKSLLRDHIISILGADFEKNIIFYTENTETTKDLVRLGVGISILPKKFVDTWSYEDSKDLKILNFQDTTISLEPSIIVNRDRYFPRYLDRLISTIIEM